MIDPDDLPGVPAIMKSIEARWAKADQEIFIAAMILNPFYRREPLVATPMFNNAGITALLGRVFKRLRRTTEVPQEFYIELNNYLNLQGTYSNLKLQLHIETNIAVSAVRNPLLLQRSTDQNYSSNENLIQMLFSMLSDMATKTACFSALHDEFSLLQPIRHHARDCSVRLDQF